MYRPLPAHTRSYNHHTSLLPTVSTHTQGLYQKAEVLYSMGDFEYALMFYHRGHKIRPELHEFTLGIQKAQEAINNSIGSKLAIHPQM